MNDFASALGRIPSGLFILTAKKESTRFAMLASWVMQAGFDPPAISVAVQRDREFAKELLSAGSRITLNILGDKNLSYLSRFSKKPEGSDPFEGLPIDDNSGYGPVLMDCHAYLTGEVANSATAGDHTVYLVEVKGGGLLQDDSPKVHIRKNGLKY